MLMLLLGTVIIAGLLYYYIVKPMRYWKDRGVEQGNPKWIFGHFGANFFGRKNGTEILQDIYEQSPNARYTGYYRFSIPDLMLRDPDLIKQITIKDFDFFTDHVDLIAPEVDPLWAKNLLTLQGSKWRDIRNHLSPSFTSSKMRILFGLMDECAENLIQHLKDKNQKVLTVEMKDIFSRYTNDVIATTVFGVKVDSLNQPDNEFYKMGYEITDVNTLGMTLKLLAYWCLPAIKHVMKIRIISEKPGKYFQNIIEEAVKIREEKGIVRPDMIHLLLEARKKALKQNEAESGSGKKSNAALSLENDDIAAHAIVFFFAGFESVASFISFTTYELAINPEVQEKLRKEVLATLEECGGKVTYEALSNMKYMDMVVSESMRKWPNFTSTDRVCTKPYTIEPVTPGEKPLYLEKGTNLTLPTFSIQHDPKYFPDPERFDPERFSDENKSNINPYAYFPFGVGPRICIGSRFSLMEGKLVLFHLLSNFEIVPVEKTAIPLKFSKNTIFSLKPTDGFWVGFKRYTE